MSFSEFMTTSVKLVSATATMTGNFLFKLNWDLIVECFLPFFAGLALLTALINFRRDETDRLLVTPFVFLGCLYLFFPLLLAPFVIQIFKHDYPYSQFAFAIKLILDFWFASLAINFVFLKLNNNATNRASLSERNDLVSIWQFIDERVNGSGIDRVFWMMLCGVIIITFPIALIGWPFWCLGAYSRDIHHCLMSYPMYWFAGWAIAYVSLMLLPRFILFLPVLLFSREIQTPPKSIHKPMFLMLALPIIVGALWLNSPGFKDVMLRSKRDEATGCYTSQEEQNIVIDKNATFSIPLNYFEWLSPLDKFGSRAENPWIRYSLQLSKAGKLRPYCQASTPPLNAETMSADGFRKVMRRMQIGYGLPSFYNFGYKPIKKNPEKCKGANGSDVCADTPNPFKDAQTDRFRDTINIRPLDSDEKFIIQCRKGEFKDCDTYMYYKNVQVIVQSWDLSTIDSIHAVKSEITEFLKTLEVSPPKK